MIIYKEILASVLFMVEKEMTSYLEVKELTILIVVKEEIA